MPCGCAKPLGHVSKRAVETHVQRTRWQPCHWLTTFSERKNGSRALKTPTIIVIKMVGTKSTNRHRNGFSQINIFSKNAFYCLANQDPNDSRFLKWRVCQQRFMPTKSRTLSEINNKIFDTLKRP
jgi:hypothetical protein